VLGGTFGGEQPKQFVAFLDPKATFEHSGATSLRSNARSVDWFDLS
jgi:hypothetical protein